MTQIFMLSKIFQMVTNIVKAEFNVKSRILQFPLTTNIAVFQEISTSHCYYLEGALLLKYLLALQILGHP